MTKPEKEFTGVRAKLKKYKDDNTGFRTETLPKSGIEVSIPKYLNHGAWMTAQRQAKGDVPRAQAAMIIGSVKFEDEKLTMADVQAGLIEAKDMLFLVGEVFGDDDDEDAGEGTGEDEGKGKAAA